MISLRGGQRTLFVPGTGSAGLRLSELNQISDFFSFQCQTYLSFSSVGPFDQINLSTSALERFSNEEIYGKLQGFSKKGTLAIVVLFRLWKSDFTFSHVFRNQNFEPVSSFTVCTEILLTVHSVY